MIDAGQQFWERNNATSSQCMYYLDASQRTLNHIAPLHVHNTHNEVVQQQSAINCFYMTIYFSLKEASSRNWFNFSSNISFSNLVSRLLVKAKCNRLHSHKYFRCFYWIHQVGKLVLFKFAGDIHNASRKYLYFSHTEYKFNLSYLSLIFCIIKKLKNQRTSIRAA